MSTFTEYNKFWIGYIFFTRGDFKRDDIKEYAPNNKFAFNFETITKSILTFDLFELKILH